MSIDKWSREKLHDETQDKMMFLRGNQIRNTTNPFNTLFNQVIFDEHSTWLDVFIMERSLLDHESRYSFRETWQVRTATEGQHHLSLLWLYCKSLYPGDGELQRDERCLCEWHRTLYEPQIGTDPVILLSLLPSTVITDVCPHLVDCPRLALTLSSFSLCFPLLGLLVCVPTV